MDTVVGGVVNKEDIRNGDSLGPGLFDDLNGIRSVAHNGFSVENNPLPRQLAKFLAMSLSPGEFTASGCRGR